MLAEVKTSRELDETMRPWEDTQSFLSLKEDTQCLEPQMRCSWTLSVYDIVLCLPATKVLLHLKTPGDFLTFEIFLDKTRKREVDTGHNKSVQGRWSGTDDWVIQAKDLNPGRPPFMFK